ncbi:MAG TPA: ACP S-malonyltransferase [Aminobacteriaceae bacterium]|nr:ACP S-malonyltransferase [Aminobacteriaceae bacterium]
MSYSLIFPGQGSQEVGMGRDIRDAFKSAAEVFQRADDALSFSLSKIIFDGPEEELRRTAYTQPAILVASIAAISVLEELVGKRLQPASLAGHSLGEYTALVAARTLSLEDGVRLVHLRGRLMQEAVPEGKGAMAAILGLDAQAVSDICQEVAPLHECQPANFNSPGQIVISGETEFVEKAMLLAKEKGAKKTVLLNVSAPFHSRLMRPVADQLLTAFKQCAWGNPSAPIVSNVRALPVANIQDIQDALFHQTYMPVLWEKSVHWMADSGVDTFFEIGPGTVLGALVKKCRKGLTAYPCGTLATLEKTAALLKEMM